jgi:hypothetical protein
MLPEPGKPRTKVAGALDVDAEHPQEKRTDGLDLVGDGRGRLSQEGAAEGEVRRPATIGEPAEVADADEAVGDDVEEEPPEKLVDIEVHDLHAVAVGVVAPAEADPAVSQREEPVVGERDAVGVATEVGEHVLGASEGRFAVDDPRLLPELGEVAAPEDLSEGADGEEGATHAAGRRASARWSPAGIWGSGDSGTSCR